MAYDQEEEEDDYLSMAFADGPGATVKETSLQRTARLKREAAERGKVLSKADRAEQEKTARELALATRLDSSNKGARLMAKMGFQGGALGAAGNQGRENPVELLFKDDRGGIGMDSEKKRKIRDAAENTEEAKKRTKVSEDEYRERNRAEREEKRAEGQWWSAMKVLEGFEEEEEEKEEESPRRQPGEDDVVTPPTKPLHSVNLLYRPLLKGRMEKDRERRARNDLLQSLSRNREYDDPDADREDQQAFGLEIEDNIDEADPELTEYEELDPAKRLQKVIEHLRHSYHYCFWCKFRYANEEMEGCPGLSEDEHG